MSTSRGFGAVAAGVESILAPDGSYFLNIKEHADDGERDLYVMDLVIAHRRQWGWRFVDTFCWRKTDNGVPGGWGNRFKNAWEPVFHFCRQQQIKFRPQAVSHESEDCFDYSPNNPKSNSGSGLLGTGARGAAADGGKNQSAWQRSRNSLSDDSDGRHTGLARPSNVVEVKIGVLARLALRSVPARAGGVLLAGVLRRGRRGLRSVHGQRNDDGRGGVARQDRLRLRDQPGLLRCDCTAGR